MDLRRIATCILLAAKIDRLKRKYPQFENELERIREEDPSGKGKYLEWAVKQLKEGVGVDEIITLTRSFHDNQQRLQNKDIFSYTPDELEDTIGDLEEKVVGEKIYEDKDGQWPHHVLVFLDSKGSAIKYGASTKWCITSESDATWEEYSAENYLFYVWIDKTRSTREDPLAKIIITVMRNVDNSVTSLEARNAIDKVIPLESVPPEIIGMIEQDASARPQAEFFEYDMCEYIHK